MKRKKTILILGASADQLFAIKTAKKMGLYVIALDMNSKSIGFKYADNYAVISTKDIKNIFRYIDDFQKRKWKIDGVLTMGSDIPQIVSEISRHIGTPGITKQTAYWCTNKYEMKKRFREKGVPIPWFEEINDFLHLKKIIKEKGFPLVIKPVDRSGARGVFRLTEKDDIEKLYNISLSYSFSQRVMIEEYLEGLQISTESIIYEGKVYTPGFADRNYELLEKMAPYIIENGGWMPSVLSEEKKRPVLELLEKAVSALKIENSVMKGDIVLTKEGPKIIEVAGRLSGGDFSAGLIPLSIGVNIVETMIDISVGNKPKLEKLKPNKCVHVANRYFFSKTGTLKRIEGIENIRKYNWLNKIEFYHDLGDKVKKTEHHGERLGCFVVTAKTRDELEKRIQIIYKTTKIIIS
jgi:biotin carboxylase